MAKVLLTEGFVGDMLQVELASKRNEIKRNIELLSAVPEIGSRILPKSIRETYGHTVRKIAINPFDVVYEYSAEHDEVHVLALVHQRAAR